MHCEIMSTPELVLSRGTSECGLSVGRAQCNSAGRTT